ncbi:MAG: CARDB domain-containing protein [bacterium]
MNPNLSRVLPAVACALAFLLNGLGGPADAQVPPTPNLPPLPNIPPLPHIPPLQPLITNVTNQLPGNLTSVVSAPVQQVDATVACAQSIAGQTTKTLNSALANPQGTANNLTSTPLGVKVAKCAKACSLPSAPDPGLGVKPALPDACGVIQSILGTSGLANLVASKPKVIPHPIGFYVESTIRNLGGQPAAVVNVTLDVSIQGKYSIFQQVAYVPIIKAGQSQELVFNWTSALPGIYDVSVFPNSNHVTLESNDADNVAATHYVIPSAPWPSNSTFRITDAAAILDVLKNAPIKMPATPNGVQVDLNVSLLTPTLLSTLFAGPPTLNATTVFRAGAIVNLLGNDWGSSRPFVVMDGLGGPYVKFTTGGGAITDFSAITLGSSSLYTIGNPASVQLLDRAMVVDFATLPTAVASTIPAIGLNGTVDLSVAAPSDHLAVAFDGGNDTSGQDVAYNTTWLNGMGFSGYAFRNEDNLTLETEISSDGLIVVHVPHFSTVYTFDDANGFVRTNDQPLSDIHWDAWNHNVQLLSNMNDASYEDFSRPLDAPLTMQDTFTITENWNVESRQGGTRFAVPFYVGPADGNGALGRYSTLAIFYYDYTSDYVGNPTGYCISYNPASGPPPGWACNVGTAGPGSQTDPQQSFKLTYTAAAKTLILEITDSTGKKVLTWSRQVGTTAGDEFQFSTIGMQTYGSTDFATPSGGWGSVQGSVDNIIITKSSPTANQATNPSPSNPPSPPALGPPKVCFTVSAEGTSHSVVHVDASCSYDPYSRGQLTYEWDWGDNLPHTYSGPYADHTYPCNLPPGTDQVINSYQIRLWVSVGSDKAQTVKNNFVRVMDADGDGLNNCEEDYWKTSDSKVDTDFDGLSDYNEVKGVTIQVYGVYKTYFTNPLKQDTDGDGIGDWLELVSTRTNPVDPDTDGDGVKDSIDQDPHADLSIRAHVTRYAMIQGAGNAYYELCWSVTCVNNRQEETNGQAEAEPAWTDLAVNVPDQLWLVGPTLNLYDDGFIAPHPINIGPHPEAYPGCTLVYSMQTGTWLGDDVPADGNGYGHCKGWGVGDWVEGQLWFYLYTNGKDGDKIPFALEMKDRESPLSQSVYAYPTVANFVGLNPFINDGASDYDHDGVANWDEVRWGLDPHVKDVKGFDVDVAVPWCEAADSAWMKSLQGSIRTASDDLWDATSGKFLFGKVTIHTCTGSQSTDPEWVNADIQIFHDKADNTVGHWFMANVGGIDFKKATDPACQSVPSTCQFKFANLGHVFMAMSEAKDVGVQVDGPPGNRWAKDLAHEWGHYAFYLQDEYKDHNGKTNANTHCYEHGDSNQYETLMDGSAYDPGLEFSAEGDYSATNVPPSCANTMQWQTTPGPNHSAWFTIFNHYSTQVDMSLMKTNAGIYDSGYHPAWGPHESVGDSLWS